MPRCVRNFWVEPTCDGYVNLRGFGPKSSGSGFRLRIYMRSKGKVKAAAWVSGKVLAGGRLALELGMDGYSQELVVTEER